MRKYILLLAAATLAAPLAAQTTAPSPAPVRPASRALARRTTSPAADSVRFASIRARYRREMETERAALRRIRERMHQELTAAGWHPRVRDPRMTRFAAFRAGERAGIRVHRTRALRRRGRRDARNSE
jgi:hypothetical protein